MGAQCLEALDRGDYAGKKLAIFGAGYIGGALAVLALRGGLQVTALTRNHQKAQQLQAAGVHEVVVAQLDSDAWHDQIARDQDYLVNCVSSAGGGLSGYQRSYVDGNDSIQQWSAQGGGGRFVFTSSTSVYPQADKQWVDESSPSEGCSESGKLLLSAESTVSRMNVGAWWVLRLAGIYGPGRHYLLDAIRDGRETLPGRGDFYLNLIHQWDICSAILEVLLNEATPTNRVYNVADGNPSTKAEVVQWLAQELGREPPAFCPDTTSGRSARRLNESGKLPDRRVSNQALLEQTNWAPRYRDFREGFRDLLVTG